jgi:hypothetical protein
MPKHTPGPWRWGDDWPTVDQYDEHRGECGGEKYADCQLYGADGSEIIPIRYDHYAPLWDTADPPSPKPADRSLIAAAPELLDELKNLVEKFEPLEQSGRLGFAGLGVLNGARAAIAKASA